MPTNKKRVGFIPREDVWTIIDKLSIENNLSISKIISILVEEALSTRGIFNNKTGKVNQSYLGLKDTMQYSSEEFNDSEDNEEFSINTKIRSDKNSTKTKLFKQITQDDFDVQTYKNFLSFLKFQEMMDKFDN